MGEEQKTYRIEELLVIAVNWLNNPEGEEETKALEDLKAALIIKDYMPIGQKELLLRKTIIDMRSDEEIMPYTASILYEIAILFDCLLAYVVNLDPNIDSFYKDAAYYDVLKLSGLTDYIMSFCEKDYNVLYHMAEKMISFDNLKELAKNIEISSPEQIERLTDEFKRFTTETNPELLKALGNIAAVNDPLLMSIKNNIEEEAFKASQIVGEE